MAVPVVSVVPAVRAALVALRAGPVPARVLTGSAATAARVATPVPAVAAAMVWRARRAWWPVSRARPAVPAATPVAVEQVATAARLVPVEAMPGRAPPFGVMGGHARG